MPAFAEIASPTVTVAELIAESGLARIEAQCLLAHLLGRERAWLIAHAEAPVARAQAAQARTLFARRRAGEPLAYLVGEREFFGVPLRVDARVLVPRPETERLVEIALERLPPSAPRAVLDLGTGSGAIAIALALARPSARIVASDRSAAALALARENAARCGARICFVASNWFAAIAEFAFDLIVSNPPYVASDDPHWAQGDLRFEPRAALDGGADGMEAIRAIARAARAHLRPGGVLLVEHGFDQGEHCARLFERLGYLDVRDHRDLAGLPRVCEGRLRD